MFISNKHPPTHTHKTPHLVSHYMQVHFLVMFALAPCPKLTVHGDGCVWTLSSVQSLFTSPVAPLLCRSPTTTVHFLCWVPQAATCRILTACAHLVVWSYKSKSLFFGMSDSHFLFNAVSVPVSGTLELGKQVFSFVTHLISWFLLPFFLPCHCQQISTDLVAFVVS